MMNDDWFFFEQTRFRPTPKRTRMHPEDLPMDLRQSHPNPKVANYLANKQRSQNEESFGGKKSLLPEINQAFQTVKSRLDSSLSNDEDSQRFLFEQSKATAANILHQLAKILYLYDNVVDFVPKSLEYQIMCGYKELTADIIFVPREWQTPTVKEKVSKQSVPIILSDDEHDVFSDNEDAKSRQSVDRHSESGKKKKAPQSVKSGLPGISEDEEKSELKPPQMKRGLSKLSMSSKSMTPNRSKGDKGKMVQVEISSRHSALSAYVSSMSSSAGLMPDRMSVTTESTSLQSASQGNPSFYMSTIQFQLSSRACEDKGWIVQKGRFNDEIDHETALEWSVQVLQQALKIIQEQTTQELELGFDKSPVSRYYGDAQKDAVLKYRKIAPRHSANSVHRGHKPMIPAFFGDERNEGRHLASATVTDGSCVVFYPSGRPALFYLAAGIKRSGFYTIAYEDGLDSKMLACFTPHGRGCCYHSNGVVRFLATEKGGHVTDPDGTAVRKWKWPLGSIRLANPIMIHLNQSLVFRCINHMTMTFCFTCQRETTKIYVGHNPVVAEAIQAEDNGPDQLLTSFTFSSKAAKDLLQLYAPKSKQYKKPKSYSKKDKEKSRTIVGELKKVLEIDDSIPYDTEYDRDLAKLQRRARSLVDEWMEHYQMAVGFSSHCLKGVSETPRVPRRPVQSADTCDNRSSRRETMGLNSADVAASKKLRAPSAPAGMTQRPKTSGGTRPTSAVPATVKFDEAQNDAAGDGRGMSPTAMAVFSRLLSASSRSVSARSRTPSRLTTHSGPDPSWPIARAGCNAALRAQMLEGERPPCKCSRHNIPYISDVEYDEFILKEAQDNQLIIVSVVSSLYPDASPADIMVSQIYSHQNRNRTRPCVEARVDTYRILRYDINLAADGSNHTQPVLLIRHNVVPGMFLIYKDGKLLFCDHIFNGYGNARRDFKKQIMKCKLDASRGLSLPSDFKFSPIHGRHGMRNAWGGEMGGAGVDGHGSPGTSLDAAFITLDQSGSLCSDDSREFGFSRDRNFETTADFITMSLSPNGYHPVSNIRHHLAPNMTVGTRNIPAGTVT